MKKHENAIKMLMKNAIDTKTLYGWYEDDNGARLMTNGHLLIKLSGATLDYVGDFQKMNDRNDNKRFTDQMNDIIELAKKGEHKTTVNIQDIKVFDRYNTDKKTFCVKYSDNSYIGFNPYYFNKLNILTGSDLITIIDSKSPFYMCGDDIECVLLPVALDKNYNSDNYAVFLEELKACYIQDAKAKEENEKQKALKNTDKIEKDVIYNGFTMWIGGKQYFLMSNKKRVTDEITKDFLKLIAANTTINVDKISESDFKYIKNGINSATITKTTSYYGTEEIYRIETKYNSENFYKNEYDRLIIYNGNMEKIDICADDMSTETKEETPKIATIQDNAADIVADPDATETKTADNMSANATDKAATTETANNDNVTDTNNRKRILHGFYMTFKNRDIFVATNEDTKRRYIVQAFISEMINISNHLQNITEEKRNNILNDEDVLSETKKRITPATIEEIWTSQENHIRITTNNGNTVINYSLNDFKTIMIDKIDGNAGMHPMDGIAFKFFGGISRLNNQLTETITQDIKADLQADNRQTETTQDTSNNAITSETMQADARQDTPHKTSKKAMCLFIVTDKPAPVKLPTLKQLDRIPMYVEHFKTDLQPLKSHRVYNNRVKELKPLKKAYNDFKSTVSHNNDKCAIGGGMVAVNSS